MSNNGFSPHILYFNPKHAIDRAKTYIKFSVLAQPSECCSLTFRRLSMTIIGRKMEMKTLQSYYDSERPELLIIYGRRRVGKTYLLREFFGDRLTFFFTGSVGVTKKVNLSNFDKAIIEQGGVTKTASKNWSEAFDKLKTLIHGSGDGRKVIFIDEMPWLDTPGSDFLSAFDYFWNSWASSVPDIMIVGCGSSTSWITKKLFKNRGGLHNRVTGRIYLAPFTIAECEEYFEDKNIIITRYQLAECYMIFGGIPYYLSLFSKEYSFSQNVDIICFADNAPLKNEFDELYYSLFNNPGQHINIVEILSGRSSGYSRNEICEIGNIQPNGHMTNTLNELEQCGFIEKYNDFTKKKNGVYYYLKDPFTLFYLRYMKNNNSKDEYFWTNYIDDGAHRAWSGYAYELLCRIHIKQIKIKLGILGVSTSVSVWRSKGASHNDAPSYGAQIDLLICRKDGVINLCEIKYSKHPYAISKSYAEQLENKKAVFLMETGARRAIHITMITTFGLEKKGYSSIVQSEVAMNDLFALAP